MHNLINEIYSLYNKNDIYEIINTNQYLQLINLSFLVKGDKNKLENIKCNDIFSIKRREKCLEYLNTILDNINKKLDILEERL